MAVRKTRASQGSLETFDKNIPARGAFGADKPDITEVRITQIDSESGADLGFISFTGTDIPFQPLLASSGSEIVKEYYPGGQGKRIPTIQVLGSYEENVTIQGRFKATKISDTEHPLSISNQIKTFAAEGKPCRFEIGEWIKYGFIVTYNPSYKHDTDIDWTLELMIHGDKNPVSSAAATAGGAGQAVLAADPTNTDFQNDSDQINADIATALADLNLPERGSVGVAEYVAALQSSRTDSVVKKRSVDWLNVLLEEGESATRTLGRISRESYGTVNRFYEETPYLKTILTARSRIARMKRQAFNSISATRNLSPLQSIEEKNTIGAVLAAANRIDGTLKKSEDKIEANVQRQIRKIYIAKESDTLQSVSAKEYGTVERWEDIKKANSLTDNTLSAGQILIIPS